MDDSATCKKAYEVLGYYFYSTEEGAEWPKGCYVDSFDEVYFNQHIDGSKNDGARQICKSIGKGLRSFLPSMYLLS